VTSSLAVFEAAIWVKSDKIWFENQKRKCGNKRSFLHKSLSKRAFEHKIHSLLRRADAIGSAHIIYLI